MAAHPPAQLSHHLAQLQADERDLTWIAPPLAIPALGQLLGRTRRAACRLYRPSSSEVVSRPAKPLQQGGLDALCGLYAIVNAFRHLCPELDDDLAALLFRALVRHLGRIKTKPLRVLSDGMTARQVRRLASHAAKLIKMGLGIRFKLDRLRRRERRGARLGHIWRMLRSTLKPRRVAIIGIGGIENHWSVAVHAGRTWLRLADSDGLAALKRSTCCTIPSDRRHVLAPQEILLIKRRKRSG